METLEQSNQTPTLDSAPQAEPAPEAAPAAESAPTGLDALKQKAAAGVAPTVTPAQQQTDPTPKPSYTPDYKFKAHGKEHEIPELLRGVMKDKDSEKYLKDLFEKAYGLPPLKERFEKTREQLQEIRQSHEYVMNNIQEAQQAYRRGDLDTVFEIFRVSPEKVLQWAVEKVQLSQLPPEQRQAHEARREAEKRAMELEKQNQLYSSQAQQEQSQYLSQMLEMVLERPDISAVAQAYDARRNQPGSFQALVVQIGRSEAVLSGKTLSPLEAAKKAIEIIGEQAAPAAPQAPAQAATPAQPAQATPAAQPKKTIPNLANAGAKSGAAPAKSKMRSLDDIKKAYDAISGQAR